MTLKACGISISACGLVGVARVVFSCLSGGFELRLTFAAVVVALWIARVVVYFGSSFLDL